MKKWTAIILSLAMICLAGCSQASAPTDTVTGEMELAEDAVDISLNGQKVTVNGVSLEEGAEPVYGVFLSRDIIYYEDRDTYESGNPYGEGGADERHSPEDAAAHLVVNIIQPGQYRLSGQLSLGQIRVDLGEDAYETPSDVVTLFLDGADVECTVAPAILFQNVYECDGGWSTETAKAQVDTSAAGANLVLVGGSENTIKGSHVARIFKDKDGEKKLWKQDGAIYSYMSMNVGGTGRLNLYADNEGLDTELHLTINGGDLNIRSGNDGINTNEDGVSVTTINGGNIHIIAGLGAEGDGIDSNGYLVINGGTVVSAANPAADAGLDSDLGSYIHGGTVIALGSTMDWAESDSGQVTMNLQFSGMQSSGSAIVVTREDGACVFAYDPGADEVLGENVRQYQGAVISCGGFQVGESYQVYLQGTLTGTETGGVYDPGTVTGYEGGVLQAYTGTDVMMRPGGFGGQPPEDMGGRPGNGEKQENAAPPQGEPPAMPEGEPPAMPEGEPPAMPEGEAPTMPGGEMPPNGFGGMGGQQPGAQGEAQTDFYMQDKVNFFSGVTAANDTEPQ